MLLTFACYVINLCSQSLAEARTVGVEIILKQAQEGKATTSTMMWLGTGIRKCQGHLRWGQRLRPAIVKACCSRRFLVVYVQTKSDRFRFSSFFFQKEKNKTTLTSLSGADKQSENLGLAGRRFHRASMRSLWVSQRSFAEFARRRHVHHT